MIGVGLLKISENLNPQAILKVKLMRKIDLKKDIFQTLWLQKFKTAKTSKASFFLSRFEVASIPITENKDFRLLLKDILIFL